MANNEHTIKFPPEPWPHQCRWNWCWLAHKTHILWSTYVLYVRSSKDKNPFSFSIIFTTLCVCVCIAYIIRNDFKQLSFLPWCKHTVPLMVAPFLPCTRPNCLCLDVTICINIFTIAVMLVNHIICFKYIEHWPTHSTESNSWHNG